MNKLSKIQDIERIEVVWEIDYPRFALYVWRYGKKYSWYGRTFSKLVKEAIEFFD